jgi:PAS domain S-box-containing protein
MESPFEPDRLLTDHVRLFALFGVGLDGRVETWNPGAEELFGWSAAEIVGQPVSVLWTPEDRAAGADVEVLAVAATEGAAPDGRWHLRRDGSRVWVRGDITAARGPDGRLVGYVWAGHDATAHRQAIDALQASEGALRERECHAREALAAVSDRNAALNREVAVERAEAHRLADALAEAVLVEQRRIATILHDDLQQLLVGANMRIQALRSALDGAVPPEAKADADAVLRILSEAFETTRTLTSRLVPPDLLRAPISDAFRWLADDFDETHGLQVALDVDVTDGGVTVEGHVRALLFQSARELLFNVVKHAGIMEATVTARAEPDALVVVVEDCGVGLPEDGGKAGYGLADVRTRLALVGGTLDLRARPGGGTRAVVRVDRRPA